VDLTDAHGDEAPGVVNSGRVHLRMEKAAGGLRYGSWTDMVQVRSGSQSRFHPPCPPARRILAPVARYGFGKQVLDKTRHLMWQVHVAPVAVVAEVEAVACVLAGQALHGSAAAVVAVGAL